MPRRVGKEATRDQRARFAEAAQEAGADINAMAAIGLWGGLAKKPPGSIRRGLL